MKIGRPAIPPRGGLSICESEIEKSTERQGSPIMLQSMSLFLALRDISLRCAIWSLSGHSGLWQAKRPGDLWVHGLDFDCYYMLPVAADLQEIIVKKMPENAWE